VLDVPEIKYARNGTVSIAYQMWGEGPWLVGIPPSAQNIEVAWEQSRIRRMYAAFGSFSHYLHFDKRGTGMSDPAVKVASLDERVDDLKAVLDDAGVDRAVLLGFSEGGPMAVAFAAMYPERTTGLVLWGTCATFLPRPDDHPWGFLPPLKQLADYASKWGTSESVTLEIMAPSLGADEAYRRWEPHYERQSASPAAFRRVGAMVRDIDVRAILPAVRAPTLVIHRSRDRLLPIESSRYLAQRIPGAQLIELDGDDHFCWAGDIDPWMDEVRQFMTGTRRRSEPDRLLATVLFTDLVDSTEQAARLGDRRWRELLDDHDSICRRVLTGHDGTLVKTTGDGILAWFNGPARAIRCAVEIRDELQRMGLASRAGLHAGEIERRGDDIGGIGVHIAARVEAKAAPGEVLVSRTVKDLVVGSRIGFEDRGVHRLKGVDDEWQLLAVNSTTD
jgi:class 3 adenylate cyclase/pimeloyl-ACP methyl ester carboxylesterase